MYISKKLTKEEKFTLQQERHQKLVDLIEKCELRYVDNVYSEIEVDFIKDMRKHANKFDVMTQPQLDFLASLSTKPIRKKLATA